VKAAEPVRYSNSTTDADSVVTINEVMYQPAGGNSRDEWIEVHNQTAVLVDLSAWTLEGGVDFRFPEGTTIPGGGFLVIAADPERFRSRTGVAALGPFNRRLSDNGDRVVLRNLNRRWMDGVEYRDTGDWPVGADGSGATLAKRVDSSPSSPPENWRASQQIGGTPGAANFPVTAGPPPVVQDALVGSRSPGRWRVPGAADAAVAWREPGFVDALWRSGTNGYGFGSNRVSVVPAAARHYRFERTSSDASGQGVHAVLRNGVRFVTEPAPVAGSEVAIRFDGLDDHVVIQDEGAWPAYTVALWVRFETVRAGSLVVRTDEAGPTVSWSHQLRVTTGRRFEHYTFDGGGKVVTGTTLVEPGRWYHVAATAESGGLARLYVNGLPEGGSEPVGTLWSGGSNWRLGTASQGFPNTFRGWMDDVAIWEKVLEPASFQALVQGSGLSLGSSLNTWLATDLGPAMRGVQSSVWIRQAFDAPASEGYDRLTLRVRYDDGFVAWLNGEEVARRNAPDPLTWSSRATVARSDEESVVEEVVDLTGHAGRLRPAGNVLAVQALNVAADDGDLLVSMELEGRRRSELFGGGGPLLISEVTAADQPGFFCEVANPGAGSVDLNDWVIRSSAGGEFRWGREPLEPGGWRVMGTNELGFAVGPSDRLFLFDAAGRRLVDSVALSRTGRARRVLSVTEPLLRSTHGTPAGANAISLRDEIVINEILYHAPPRYARPGESGQPASTYAKNEEQWVELFNRSEDVVDLDGWRLTDEIEFQFAAGTRLGPGEYLVVARRAAEVERLHPGIRVVGDWVGRLSGRGGRIRLLDAMGNPADDVRYFDDEPWPALADGGGSSLELNNPDADNATAGAWSASEESHRSTWRTYTYRARAVTPVKAPTQHGFHEFRMGLLAAGEVWVDDLRVVEDPDGAARLLIQNGTFDDASAWRLLGNHSASRVMDDPDRAGNRVLRLVANGARGYMHNQLETTLKSGGAVVPVVAGRWYEISFRAKWVGGSPLLHTELYYNKVARTTVLDQPSLFGTPGRRNTAWAARRGPTYSDLFHEPLVPKPGEPVVVRVRASDPDGLGALTLFTSVNGAAWQQRAMVADGDGRYSATVPAQSADAVVQFYVAGADAGGAVSWMPSRGPGSRALYRVDSRVARAPRKAFRFVLTAADGRLMDATTNMMSDDRIGATVVWDDREVFYDCGVHLRGSMFSRVNLDSVPYNMRFPADRRFRGVHRTVQLNRGVIEEIIAKHAHNQAGIPGMYEDIVDLYSHRRGNTGAARLSLAHYNDIYLASQFENGADGLLYNMEGIRVLETTHNRSVEGIKLGMPVGWVSDYDVMNLGDDPEQYRFSTTLRNNRARNDHGPYIAMAKAFSLSGTALEQAVDAVLRGAHAVRGGGHLHLGESPQHRILRATLGRAPAGVALRLGFFLRERLHQPAVGQSEPCQSDRPTGLHPAVARTPAGPDPGNVHPRIPGSLHRQFRAGGWAELFRLSHPHPRARAACPGAPAGGGALRDHLEWRRGSLGGHTAGDLGRPGLDRCA
jgi:hypothetical protein